ncbi:MAG: CpsB/CapC family capsule biosynthesis tyrosine phosphatase [Thermoanaerobaculia bacterium]|nr:CpsB/CapC family capsule biosynthesis tyrosine phosphatase [Thermoanaerobaculia bacterium]
MIDIHGHYLPGIDDGAESLQTAVAMCRLAAEDGCEAVIATPHQRHAVWDNRDPEGLEMLRRRLQEAVGERPEVHLGAEIRIGSGLLDDLDRPDRGRLTPLAGSRHLLLEYGRGERPRGCEDLVHELTVAGWRPILAHPELIRFLAEDLDLMERLAEAGALFQVTAASLTGDFGGLFRRKAWQIVERGLCHFVASDAHGEEWRPPGLARARSLIARRLGEETARRLTDENARGILRQGYVVPSGLR